MRSRIIFTLFIAIVLYPFGGETSNIVTNRVIIEIQPETYQLGDYFSTAANQVLIDSSYTFLQSREGEGLGDVTMEEIGSYLETGGYGILEYGGHGNEDGETSGETFATYQQAVNKKNELIEWLYFDAEDLVVIPRDSYYSLGLTPVYTDNSPSECSVAFISTCYGDAAGDFNASCKVAGSGGVTNAQLITSFNCLISWLENPNYRTIDLAAAQMPGYELMGIHRHERGLAAVRLRQSGGDRLRLLRLRRRCTMARHEPVRDGALRRGGSSPTRRSLANGG